MTTVSPAPEAASLTFDAATALAYVESDAVCEGCGYALRGQPIRREPVTQLVLTRCPECGRFAPINELATPGRLWLNRFSTFLVWVWLLVVGIGVLVEGLIIFGITMGSLDELIRPYRYYSWNRTPGMAVQVHQWGQDDYAFLGFIIFVVAAFGFLAGQFAAAAFPHWRSWGYLVFCLLRTSLLTVALILTWQFGYNVPNLMATEHWVAIWLPFVFGFAIIHGAAGVAAALLGRRPLRLAARLLVPRRPRTALAYLWITDGLEPPHAKPSPRPR